MLSRTREAFGLPGCSAGCSPRERKRRARVSPRCAGCCTPSGWSHTVRTASSMLRTEASRLIPRPPKSRLASIVATLSMPTCTVKHSFSHQASSCSSRVSASHCPPGSRCSIASGRACARHTALPGRGHAAWRPHHAHPDIGRPTPTLKTSKGKTTPKLKLVSNAGEPLDFNNLSSNAKECSSFCKNPFLE